MSASAIVLSSTKNMDRADWLEMRKKGIGGSDVAAIAGLSKYKSPVAVYLEKTGEIEPEEAGEAAYWGNQLEDLVAREFSNRTGLKVQRRNAMLQHPQYPFMLANLDRVIIDRERGRGILECKTASEYVKQNWYDENGEEAVPDAYMLQVQHYLAVTGYDYAYIAVLIGGNKFQYRYIPRDERIISLVITIEQDFWLNHIEQRIPPAMDGSESSAKLLDDLYPSEEPGKVIYLPDTASALLAARQQAKADEKEVQARAKDAENKLKEMIGDAEVAMLGDTKITWKMVHKKETVMKATSYRAFNVR